MENTRLLAYARLLVHKGIHPDPGQEVFISAALDQPEFVRMVVKECYLAGASRVHVEWSDMPLAKMAQECQSEALLSEVMPWETAKWRYRSETLPAFLWLDSDDPDGMEGIDQGKRARSQAARFPGIKPFRDAMENKFQWCIAGVPGKAWAKKVFPSLPENQAVEALWEAILAAARANGDPEKNWDEHNERLHQLCDRLNSFHFTELQYHSASGTDFRVGLIPQGIFAGAAEKDLSGRVFNPNIPSEEIFTSPMKGKAEGILRATKPLSWQGSLIENFTIRFAGGRAVEVHAEKGRDALEKMISMDANAAFLGECALIPCSSPINRSGVLFYNTLYDENACCHLALGRGFENCIREYEKYSLEELRAMGINDSMIHVDFMVGSEDLDITGISAEGNSVPIFRSGEWAAF